MAEANPQLQIEISEAVRQVEAFVRERIEAENLRCFPKAKASDRDLEHWRRLRSLFAGQSAVEELAFRNARKLLVEWRLSAERFSIDWRRVQDCKLNDSREGLEGQLRDWARELQAPETRKIEINDRIRRASSLIDQLLETDRKLVEGGKHE